LLQLGTCILLLVALVAPIAECFDCWDAPGVSNDVEFAVFSLILALCLVLLVSRLIANLALLVDQFSIPHIDEIDSSGIGDAEPSVELIVPPRNATPLLI
jgi:hypothetical protein